MGIAKRSIRASKLVQNPAGATTSWYASLTILNFSSDLDMAAQRLLKQDSPGYGRQPRARLGMLKS